MQKQIAVSPEVYEQIQKLAEMEHRTMGGEVAYLVEYYFTLVVFVQSNAELIVPTEGNCPPNLKGA